MTEIFASVVLGLIQGLTEFLPISSSGHLILAGSFMHLEGQVINTFDIFIQLGSILAVLVLYRSRFLALLFPSSRKTDAEAEVGGRDRTSRPFSGLRGIWLLLLTTLPAGVTGLLTHEYIKLYLFNPMTVAAALFAGAAMMILLERFKRAPRYYSLDEITPGVALGVGLCQCFAMWPGFSRSASTIMGGMLLGVERKAAAEYSFIAAVPVITAATLYDLWKNLDAVGGEHLLFFAAGFGVSFLSALVAIRVFIGLLGRIGLVPFAVYRLVLAAVVFYWFYMRIAVSL